ncbi:MAG: triose-phosphate isomerase [Paracoccaceae bacterium]
MRRKLAAGNWKMNGTGTELPEIAALMGAFPAPACDLLICPPATLISRAATLAQDHALAIGGQDCHAAGSGAHTGDISAGMLRDAGASHVILGHSERRADHAESDEQVRMKARAAQEAGLVAVVCVGEHLSDREASNTLDIIAGQLSGSVPDGSTAHDLVVAYEPVWAIGTGRTPTPDQIGEVHDYIRALLERRFGEGVGRSVRLLYGGSVKPANAAEIFAVSNVDGALVGGASLKAAEFGAIVAALEAA